MNDVNLSNSQLHEFRKERERTKKRLLFEGIMEIDQVFCFQKMLAYFRICVSWL